ncbi:MAG TPA: hypothetical protein VFS37_13775 [Conexibacter sp.]|nr:hypothetical protein [Conexibacter sp.]
MRSVSLFALALLVAFGAAVAAGSAIGPEPSGTGAAGAEPAAMADHAAEASATAVAEGHDGGHGGTRAADAAPHGLAVADGGLRLVLATPELERGRTQVLRFRIVDAHDRPVRSFQLAHERRMHAIVVRRDLTGFQHVHPRMARDGTWSVPLRLDAAGTYRLYADFRRGGEARTLASDLRVDGAADLRPLPAPTIRATSDGGDVVRLDAGTVRAGRESTLRFAVERDGAAVALAPYLGAAGHLVALRDGDGAFLHVHPQESATAQGRAAFMATFPSAGRYRLFLQYRVGAHVRTGAFTIEVRQ